MRRQTANSFNDDEVALLEQAFRGLMRGSKDLSTLARLKCFPKLAAKIMRMGERARGNPQPRLAMMLRETVLEALRAQPNSTARQLSTVLRRTHNGVSKDLTTLKQEGRVRTHGYGNKVTYRAVESAGGASNVTPITAALKAGAR